MKRRWRRKKNHTLNDSIKSRKEMCNSWNFMSIETKAFTFRSEDEFIFIQRVHRSVFGSRCSEHIAFSERDFFSRMKWQQNCVGMRDSLAKSQTYFMIRTLNMFAEPSTFPAYNFSDLRRFIRFILAYEECENWRP